MLLIDLPVKSVCDLIVTNLESPMNQHLSTCHHRNSKHAVLKLSAIYVIVSDLCCA